MRRGRREHGSAAATTATGLVAALTRFIRRPGAVVLVVAASVLAGSAGGPLGLDATLATKVTLELMHLAVAAPIVLGLTRALEPRPLPRARSMRGPSEATA